MTNKFKGQSLFNDVKNKELQAWNRCAVFFNLFGAQGKLEAQLYAAQFNDDDKKALLAMFNRVKEEGYTTTRNAVVGQSEAVLEA